MMENSRRGWNHGEVVASSGDLFLLEENWLIGIHATSHHLERILQTSSHRVNRGLALTPD